MSGHNKWSNIQHRKGAQDAKRSKVFTKIIRELTVAAREGGDANSNPRLRTAIEKAREANMPKDKMETAIKKGTGELGGEELFELTYEGYGPDGVALIISVVTDNKNRSAQEIRHILSKHGGSLAESGAVSWNFEKKSLFSIPKDEIQDSEEFMMQAIEAGADDIDDSEDPVEVKGAPDAVATVRDALSGFGYTVKAELVYEPKTTVSVSGSSAEKVMKLLNALDENDDVQDVYGNYDIDDEEMERIAESL
ncbi:MAG: YebC/PmpR family DNA-binding transcriptional regulator [Thermotogae bacterium]|nr:YebC/PmpR family DNA-binding transcriptional regulator [Thermotogota bacterium]MCP5465708.1 YebC/PmpR family DNA-binding transcriptional regulator [Thermotogota bacterium]